jgi:hypothetical protein
MCISWEEKTTEYPAGLHGQQLFVTSFFMSGFFLSPLQEILAVRGTKVFKNKRLAPKGFMVDFNLRTNKDKFVVRRYTFILVMLLNYSSWTSDYWFVYTWAAKTSLALLRWVHPGLYPKGDCFILPLATWLGMLLKASNTTGLAWLCPTWPA